MSPRIALWLGCLLFASSAHAGSAANAEIAQLRGVIRGLEQRLAELEESQALRVRDEVRANLAPVEARDHWSDRVRIGGSASLAYQDGGDDSPFDQAGASVWDARLFVDADLGRDLALGEQPLVRDVGFSLEWDLVRLSEISRLPAGEVYADLRGVLAQDWLNLQVGRFHIPFGEAYRLYSRGYANRPFVTNPIAAPWFWDEGVRIHGDFAEQSLGYVFAWSNGDSMFQQETDSDKALTLKLWAHPFDWLDLSVSGHRSGRIGSPSEDADSAIWFGETWFRGLGDGAGQPIWSHGVIVPDGDTELDDVTALGGDAIWRWGEHVQGWLAYGGIQVDDHLLGANDRDLHYWIAELVLQGSWLARRLAPFYAALRASGLGTYDRDEGYLLDVRYGDSVGYNMHSLESWSLGLGWRLNENLTLRAEYALIDIDLVRGAPMRDAVRDADSLALELGVRF
jgi:hypothetical protein